VRLVHLVERLVRHLRRARRHAPLVVLHTPSPPPVYASVPPRFAHVLLVEADELRGEIAATVELVTNVELRGAHVRVEVVDDEDAVRAYSEDGLPDRATARRGRFELSMSSANATVTELLGWRWFVVLRDDRGERARWCEHLTGPDRIDVEAEIMLPPSIPHSASEHVEADEELSIDAIVRLLRHAAALARAPDPV
jgi:hypothetical protein